MNDLLLLISPITELFPSLGGSYFLPRSLDKQFFNNTFFIKLISVILVWTPILYKLYQKNHTWTIIAGIFVITGFILRSRVEWHDYLPSTLFYTIGLLLIHFMLLSKCTTNSCKLSNVLAVSMILGGGYLMGKYRSGNITIDIIGRVVFSIGFIMFIKNIQ